ncbi:hypothetical protein IWQ62_001038 [Dispira parvispora]|uniref:Uncharacterized protein n=1 Tax=Dispira parvispora TaxID=1520584 RepID=A0A9W8ATH7_9FUNG|nr:hypothetical protein IWQ62_001038 [Dispira parvispora]
MAAFYYARRDIDARRRAMPVDWNDVNVDWEEQVRREEKAMKDSKKPASKDSSTANTSDGHSNNSTSSPGASSVLEPTWSSSWLKRPRPGAHQHPWKRD